MSLRLTHPEKSLSCNKALFTLLSTVATLIVILAVPGAGRASVGNQFIRLTTYPSGGAPAKTVSADFNRDGKADIVALNSNGVLSLLPGSGNGAFGAAKTIATLPPFPFVPLLSAGDFNGDGNPDVTLLGSPGSAVQVYLGHGDGTFAAPVSIGDGLSSAGGMATGDFNGDGKADIAVVSSTSIAVLLGKSVGIFAAPIVTVTNLTAPASLVLALGDMNRDAHLDAVITDQNGGIQVMLGNGGGGFNRKAVFSDYNLPAPPNVIAIGDFNGTGSPTLSRGWARASPNSSLRRCALSSVTEMALST